MPYIKQEDRDKYGDLLKEFDTLLKCYGCTPGDLNYVVSKLVNKYVSYKGLNYTHLNDVVGVLESAKAEFQRRVVNPYEDQKINENGDI